MRTITQRVPRHQSLRALLTLALEKIYLTIVAATVVGWMSMQPATAAPTPTPTPTLNDMFSGGTVAPEVKVPIQNSVATFLYGSAAVFLIILVAGVAMSGFGEKPKTAKKMMLAGAAGIIITAGPAVIMQLIQHGGAHLAGT